MPFSIVNQYGNESLEYEFLPISNTSVIIEKNTIEKKSRFNFPPTRSEALLFPKGEGSR